MQVDDTFLWDYSLFFVSILYDYYQETKDIEIVKELWPAAYRHLHVGEKDKALELMRTYWGGMISLGADTFWEAFDPKDTNASPYGNAQVNSFCHAWSCTPAWLLREYF